MDAISALIRKLRAEPGDGDEPGGEPAV